MAYLMHKNIIKYGTWKRNTDYISGTTKRAGQYSYGQRPIPWSSAGRTTSVVEIYPWFLLISCQRWEQTRPIPVHLKPVCLFESQGCRWNCDKTAKIKRIVGLFLEHWEKKEGIGTLRIIKKFLSPHFWYKVSKTIWNFPAAAVSPGPGMPDILKILI